MQACGRLRLRPWLEEQIQSGRYPGVSWLDQSAQIFQIPWKHAARHGWSIDQDATLFRSWAMHTGRYRPGKDKPDPKTWKANFRCALNSLPDVCELQDQSRKRGSNAFRVYRMLPSTQPQRRRRGLFGRSEGRRASLGEDVSSTWQPRPSRNVSTPRTKDGGPSEDSEDTRTHGMWEPHPEDQEQNEAVFNIMEQDQWTQSWRAPALWDQWQCSGADGLYPDQDTSGLTYLREPSNWC